MLSKLGTGIKQLDPASAERLADVFFEIGSGQAKRSMFSEALRWLEKAFDVIACQSLEKLSADAGELRLSTMHGVVKALMNIGGKENIARARSIVAELEIDFGGRLAVLLLKLDLHDTDATSSAHEYCDVLRKIICSVRLTESNIKTILHQVHKLQQRNTGLAHNLLAMLISERLLGAEEPAWLEKALITVVWNCTTSTDLDDALNLLRTVVDTVTANLDVPLSASATHAAHIVCEILKILQAAI